MMPRGPGTGQEFDRGLRDFIIALCRKECDSEQAECRVLRVRVPGYRRHSLEGCLGWKESPGVVVVMVCIVLGG